MRNISFVEGEYYHILGRGNNKQKIFLNKGDYTRFLFLILFFQLPKTFGDIGFEVSKFLRDGKFSTVYKDKDLKNKYVELVSFCLMPNHYHLIVKENKEGGISRYMQRILNSFTKYHNTKYEKVGNLFQGPFKAIHVDSNEQLLHLSAYIHHNSKELKNWKGKEIKYPWSSYLDYCNQNRWVNLLIPGIILGQFDSVNDYKDFVEESGVKEFKE